MILRWQIFVLTTIMKCKFFQKLSVIITVFCPRARLSLQTQEPRLKFCPKAGLPSQTKVAVLLGMNRCSSFPLLSARHSFLSMWTDIKRSEKTPGAPTRWWGEWIWLIGPLDNIKMDLREVGCDPRDRIALAEDRDQWRAYVRAVMNLRFPWKPIS